MLRHKHDDTALHHHHNHCRHQLQQPPQTDPATPTLPLATSLPLLFVLLTTSVQGMADQGVHLRRERVSRHYRPSALACINYPICHLKMRNRLSRTIAHLGQTRVLERVWSVLILVSSLPCEKYAKKSIFFLMSMIHMSYIGLVIRRTSDHSASETGLTSKFLSRYWRPRCVYRFAASSCARIVSGYRTTDNWMCRVQ